MGTGITIWKWGFSKGCVNPRFHMAITIWKRGTVSFSSLLMGMRSPLRVSQSRESGKISISCPKFGGRCSSMHDLEVTKNTLPISIWGVPVQKWAGRVEYSHMGSPRFRIEFVSIWGSTYILTIHRHLGHCSSISYTMISGRSELLRLCILDEPNLMCQDRLPNRVQPN
jgi:hypothetical protein